VNDLTLFVMAHVALAAFYPTAVGPISGYRQYNIGREKIILMISLQTNRAYSMSK
jgi:hypothetical protein